MAWEFLDGHLVSTSDSSTSAKTGGIKPPKPSIQDKKDRLAYVLQKTFEAPGAFENSNIVAVSTDREMIFNRGNVLAKEEFHKFEKLGKWDYFVLIYDNQSGKFLGKVDIPRYKE